MGEITEMSGFKTIVLMSGGTFSFCEELDPPKNCRYCKKKIQWGYTALGKPASIEDYEGNFRLHFPVCKKMIAERYPDEFIPRTNGVDTNEKHLRALKNVY